MTAGAPVWPPQPAKPKLEPLHGFALGVNEGTSHWQLLLAHWPRPVQPRPTWIQPGTRVFGSVIPQYQEHVPLEHAAVPVEQGVRVVTPQDPHVVGI